MVMAQKSGRCDLRVNEYTALKYPLCLRHPSLVNTRLPSHDRPPVGAEGRPARERAMMTRRIAYTHGLYGNNLPLRAPMYQEVRFAVLALAVAMSTAQAQEQEQEGKFIIGPRDFSLRPSPTYFSTANVPYLSRSPSRGWSWINISLGLSTSLSMK